MKTLVVCPDCEQSFVVKDIPKRTNCRTCSANHKFNDLKKFYQSDDSNAVRRARTKLQAKLDGNSDLYEQAAEEGALQETVDGIIQEDEYLLQMGADIEQVNEAEDRALEAKHRSKSKEDIIFDAVEKQDSPNRQDVAAYAEQFGFEREDALDKLDKFRERGDIGGVYDGPFRVH